MRYGLLTSVWIYVTHLISTRIGLGESSRGAGVTVSCDVIRPQMVASEWTILLEWMILGVPCGKFLHSYGKWSLNEIVDLPIKNGDVP